MEVALSPVIIRQAASMPGTVNQHRRAPIIIMVCVALSLLSSCATAEPPLPEPSGLVTYPLPEDWYGMAGLKIGTLAFIDNCVRFDDGAIPVFPDSLTTWDGTTLTFAGQEYQMGDEISIGGGSLGGRESVSTPIPESCGTGAVIIVSPPSRSE